MRKINEQKNDNFKDETNEVVKFYYTLLKERQDWLMSKARSILKKMTALMLFNTVILLAIIIFLLRNQLPFY